MTHLSRPLKSLSLKITKVFHTPEPFFLKTVEAIAPMTVWSSQESNYVVLLLLLMSFELFRYTVGMFYLTQPCHKRERSTMEFLPCSYLPVPQMLRLNAYFMSLCNKTIKHSEYWVTVAVVLARWQKKTTCTFSMLVLMLSHCQQPCTNVRASNCCFIKSLTIAELHSVFCCLCLQA